MTPRELGWLRRAREALEERADARAALIAAVLANIHRAQGATAFGIEDFMLTKGPRDREPQTTEQVNAQAIAAFARLGMKPRT